MDEEKAPVAYLVRSDDWDNVLFYVGVGLFNLALAVYFLRRAFVPAPILPPENVDTVAE